MLLTLRRPARVQGEPAAVIAYRHQAFQGMGKHIKAVSMAAKGRVTLPQKDP